MTADVPRIVLVGGGGHARVLIDALQAAGLGAGLAVLDAHAGVATVLGVPVLGGDSLLPTLAAAGARGFVIAVGAAGNNAPRARLFDLACSYGLEPVTVVHPRAIVSPWAQLGAGAQVLAGAVVNAGACVGLNAIVNTGAIVEHDCSIGDHAHVATGARLASTVRVGNLAHVGVGATVRQVLTIGDGAVVGAGAVVVKDVAPSAVVVGVPAKELKR